MNAQPLIEADKAFNTMAQQQGVGDAFLAYSAEDPVLIRQGSMPLIGRSAFQEGHKDFKMTRSPRLPLYAALMLSLALPLGAGAQEQGGGLPAPFSSSALKPNPSPSSPGLSRGSTSWQRRGS